MNRNGFCFTPFLSILGDSARFQRAACGREGTRRRARPAFITSRILITTGLWASPWRIEKPENRSPNFCDMPALFFDDFAGEEGRGHNIPREHFAGFQKGGNKWNAY